MGPLPRRSLIPGVLLALGAIACADTFSAGAAVVNGTRISRDDVDARVVAVTQGQPADANAQRQALQQLIEETILRQAAEERGLTADEAEVDESLSQIQAQFPDEASFQQALTQRGFTLESLRNAIRDQVLQQALVTDLAGEVSEADIREVYETEVDRFTEARIRHILVRVEDPANDDAARTEAEGLLRRIRAGERFGDVARAESDDEGSATQGGDLGFTSITDFVPEFGQAAGDAEVNELVGPVRTQFGYHILQVLERRVTPFEEAEPVLRQQLEQQLGQSTLSGFLDEQLKSASIEVNPRYGDWDPETSQIVPHEGFVPPDADPLLDPNAFQLPVP